MEMGKWKRRGPVPMKGQGQAENFSAFWGPVREGRAPTVGITSSVLTRANRSGTLAGVGYPRCKPEGRIKEKEHSGKRLLT